jgi:integrase/recombinase XerD
VALCPSERLTPDARFTPQAQRLDARPEVALTALAPVADHAPALVDVDVNVDEATFRAFIRLHVARQNAAEATVVNYLREARFFRRWLAERELVLRDLTNRDVRTWIAELVEAGYRPTTIALKLAAVRRLIDAAVDAGILAWNPAADVAAPHDRRVEGAAAQRTLSVDEVRAILAAIPDGELGERDRALAALLIGHGLRSVELVRINLADVDLANKTLFVRGKTADRLVFLRADVVERVAAVLERRRGEGAAPNDALFVSLAKPWTRGARGARLGRRGIRFIVDRLYAAAGLLPADRRGGKALRRAEPGAKRAARAVGKRVPTTHGLRATNVTLAIAGGAELEHVAADVGHRDIRTTMRYVQLQRRRENNSALRLPVEF